MTGKELYALFIDDGITFEEVAVTDFGDMVRHIAEARLKEPDDIGLSDMEIAMRVQEYAAGDVDLTHVGQPELGARYARHHLHPRRTGPGSPP